MKTKLIACAALLMAACCGSPSARKAAATKTEVKHGPEIVLAAPDTVGGTSVNEALANSIVAQLLFLEMEDPDDVTVITYRKENRIQAIKEAKELRAQGKNVALRPEKVTKVCEVEL